MPVGVSDFIKIPDSFKYVLLFIVLIGTVVPIPLIGVSAGEIIFEPFRIGFGAIGIFVNFQLFFILLVMVGLVLFAITLNQG